MHIRSKLSYQIADVGRCLDFRSPITLRTERFFLISQAFFPSRNLDIVGRQTYAVGLHGQHTVVFVSSSK